MIALRSILLYGHLDKQPPLTDTWAEGLHPYKPVIKDGKLYGRGGSDDGYSMFAALASIENLQQQNLPHGRCVIFIEASEESGSPDLPFYIEKLRDRIGVPDLIICLDSGCGNYDQLWFTNSLRGMVAGDLRVSVLKGGVHSGHASGIVPSSFRIMRMLLDRLEDSKTGKIIPKELYVDIPEEITGQSQSCATALGSDILDEFPFVGNTQPVTTDLAECLLNRTWRPTLSITGVDGLPTLALSGNVLRPTTALKLSIRTPPGMDAQKAAEFVKELLEKDPPYGAEVSFVYEKSGSGWVAPTLSDWLQKSASTASETFYGQPLNFLGEGGSIPFMGMLGKMFPEAQFCVTGLLGPESNAHGPDEMLVIDFAKKLTSCVSKIVNDHYNHFSA